jgi:hypothetical protein
LHRRGGARPAGAAPEHGEQRIPGDDVPLRHGVENAARRGHIAPAAEGADALVITEEVAGGDGGGAGASGSGRHGHCQSACDDFFLFIFFWEMKKLISKCGGFRVGSGAINQRWRDSYVYVGCHVNLIGHYNYTFGYSK